MSLPLGKIRFNLSAQGKATIRQAWRTPARSHLPNARHEAEEYGLRILELRGVAIPARHYSKVEPISGPLNGFVAFFNSDTGEEFAMVKLSAQPDQFKVHAGHNGPAEAALPIIKATRAKPRQPIATAAHAPAPMVVAFKPAAPVLPPAPDEGFNLAGKVFWHLSRGRMHRTQVAA